MKIPFRENQFFYPLDLGHSSSPNGNIEFDWSLIEDICAASGMDIAEFLDTREHDASMLIHQWYTEHRARGAPDPVMEDIITAAKIEEVLDELNTSNGNEDKTYP